MAHDTERSGRSARRAERVPGEERERESRGGPRESQGERSGSRSGREIARRQPIGSPSAMRPLPSIFSMRPQELFSAGPFELMRRMSEEMNRAFEGFGFGAGNGGGMTGALFTPSVEVTEREGELCVCVDLPGLEPDDVQVEMTEDGLLVSGERRRESEDESQGWYRSERSYGRFARMIPLPPGADAEGANARFENGVLRITVPMSEARGRRSIPIQAQRGERSERESGERERQPREAEGTSSAQS